MRETDEFRLAPSVTKPKSAHHISIDNREKATITGVLDVESFNDSEIIIRSQAGMLTLFGQGLHINKLDLDMGQLHVDGFIGGVEYHEEPEKQSGGVFSKIFR